MNFDPKSAVVCVLPENKWGKVRFSLPPDSWVYPKAAVGSTSHVHPFVKTQVTLLVRMFPWDSS